MIWDELELRGSEDSIRRPLKACDWSTKKTRRVARERDAESRDACLEELSEYKSYSIALAVGLLVCRAPRRRPRRWAGNETLAVARSLALRHQDLNSQATPQRHFPATSRNLRIASQPGSTILTSRHLDSSTRPPPILRKAVSTMRLLLVLSLSLYFSLFTIARTNRSRLCVDEDAGLQWLSSRLSEDSTITCRQNRQTADSTGRYWAAQLVNDASVVVIPASSEDVSLAVQATMKTPLGRDYAFVSGGHSLTGASSSRGLVIDLKRLNHTTVLHNFTDPMTQRGITVVMYEGGVTSFGLQSAVNGTGWTAVTPRASSVGMGGFSTGGGIGFMANAYGYAIDRLVALEVVLPSGEIVIATKKNKHSDLFWAIRGGSGQFGIVTKFYQKAFRTPKNVKVGFHVVGNGSVTQSFRNTEVFFGRHTDPFSLMYYALAYLPIGWPHAREEEMGFRVTRLMVTLR